MRARIAAHAASPAPLEVVVPYGQRALRSPVGMLLLRRYLEDTQLPVYLVTADGQVRRHARQQGVACGGRTLAGEQLLAALRAAGGQGGAGPARYLREQRALSDARWRALRRAAAVACAALLPPLAGVWVLTPTATITLRVPAETIDESLQLRVSALAASVDAEDATVPGRVVEVPIDLVVTGAATGSVPDPASLARGTVRLTNRGDQPVRVPAGTRLATADNVLFATQTEVIVHPGLPQGPTVPVVALEGGARSNARAKESWRIDDAQLAGRLAVENEAPFTGGQDTQEKAVTEQDYHRLRAEAMNQARDAALRDIERRLPADTAIAPGSLRIRINTEELTPRIGSPATTMKLAITGTARALTFHNEDLRAIVRRRIAISQDDHSAATAQLSVSLGRSVSADNDVAVFEARVEGTVGRWLDDDQIRRLAAGKTPAEARRALLAFAPSSAPSIRLTTFWADRVPPFPWRISVIQAPGG